MTSAKDGSTITEGSTVATPSGDTGNQRICTVCQGTASGVYFGSLVCLPCKSFFIRSTKDGEPNFTCVANQGNCDIILGNRLKCQFCRYQKCLNVGMCRKEKPEVVDVQEGQKLCDVCHDIANGIHFGVPTCEGCKKFFRRGMKEAEIYECKLNMNCPINPRNRNTCRYCRYQRCLAVGMSKQAIQMGRPKKEAIQGKRILQTGQKEPVKAEAPQLCVVCSDLSSGIHFDVPTCEDCKVFFLYGNRDAENFKCINNRMCDLDFRNKTTCHFCWYQKCLSEGMKVPGDQMAKSPKRHRSESSVTHLSDLNCQRNDPDIPSTLPVSGPVSSTIPYEQPSLNDMHKGMSQGHIPPMGLNASKQDKMQFYHSAANSSFDTQALTSNNFSLYDLIASGDSDGSHSENTVSALSFDSFVDNVNTDAFDMVIDMKDEPHVVDHSGVFDSTQITEVHDIGYINERKLMVVNEFYDKTTGQKGQTCVRSTPLLTENDALTGNYSSERDHSNSDKEVPQSAENLNDVTNAVFSSHMNHLHPQDSKLEPFVMNHSDPNKQVILEKQNAKLSLFSRYYWKSPFHLPRRVVKNSHSILIIARIIRAYKTFLEKTDEGQSEKHILNQRKRWPDEKCKHVPMWEHIKNRIMNNTRACVDFIRSSLTDCRFSGAASRITQVQKKKIYPDTWKGSATIETQETKVDKPWRTEPMHLNQDDAKVLFSYGGFQAMIVLSTRERYNPEEKTFQYFWNWKIPPKSPAYQFRQNLLNAAQDLYNLNMDITESAIMCVFSVISADWIILREPELVEKLRNPITIAFQEYLSVKYGCESKRGEELMKMMPVLRELTLWHSEMLANMKLSIKTEEMDGLFKTLVL